MIQLGTQSAIDIKQYTNAGQTPADKYKTNLCAKFKMGYYSYGNKCLFAHGNGELRKRLPGPVNVTHGVCPMSKQSKVCRMFSSGKECKIGDKRSGNGRSNPWPGVKRRLCNCWKSTGSCPFGDTCLFAHGQSDLERPDYHIALTHTNTTRNMSTQQVQCSKLISRSKAIQKLDGVYADWI